MAAAGGNCYSAAVGEDGALFVWGNGEYGQLLTGDTANRLVPTRVAGIACSVSLLKPTGSLFFSLSLSFSVCLSVCLCLGSRARFPS